jgi:hypothetical protein
MRRFWNCGKDGNYKRDYKLKAGEKSPGDYGNQSIEGNTSLDKGGYVYLELISTQSEHDFWLIE